MSNSLTDIIVQAIERDENNKFWPAGRAVYRNDLFESALRYAKQLTEINYSVVVHQAGTVIKYYNLSAREASIYGKPGERLLVNGVRY